MTEGLINDKEGGSNKREITKETEDICRLYGFGKCMYKRFSREAEHQVLRM